jgi:hypothetical protein
MIPELTFPARVRQIASPFFYLSLFSDFIFTHIKTIVSGRKFNTIKIANPLRT